MFGNEVVATTTYNVESESIEMPEFEDEGGYTFVAETFDYKNKHEDFTVNVTREETPYTAIFVSDENVSYTATYTISSPVVHAPAGPSGYNTKWVCGSVEVNAGDTIDFTGRLGNYTFNKVATPKQYKIKYVQNGEIIQEQTVDYDSNYTLIDVVSPNPDYDGVCWADANDVEFQQSGKWTLDHDVELHALWGLSFEKNTLTSVLPTGNRTNYSIDKTQGTSGGQCLRVDIGVTGQVGDYGIKIAESFLNDCFADPEVVAINFDAKASVAASNFRARYYAEGKVSNWTYENNYTPCGVDTKWKTFSFKREYMQGLEYFIYGALSDGETLWVDNIRPVKRHLDLDMTKQDGGVLGFENGYRVQNPSNVIFYDGGHANATPVGKQVFLANGDATRSVDYSYDVKSEGNRSIKLNKVSGYSAVYISTALVNYIGENGYITFDVYSTVGCNSNPTTAVLVDGASTDPSKDPHAEGFGGEGYIHPAETWVTYTVPRRKITNDGRFAQIMGSTAGDWYFDNIKVYPGK